MTSKPLNGLKLFQFRRKRLRRREAAYELETINADRCLDLTAADRSMIVQSGEPLH